MFCILIRICLCHCENAAIKMIHRDLFVPLRERCDKNDSPAGSKVGPRVEGMVHTMTGSIALAWINHVKNQKKRTRFVSDIRLCFICK